jgi:predicted negative regulator of RcsB-dependent stress response
MKRLGIFLLIIGILAAGAYYAYQYFLPTVVAHSITSETDHSWIPFDAHEKITKIKKPVNEMADEVIRQVHESRISMDDIIKAIDEAREEQAYAMLDDMNATQIDSVDQVFSMAKKHFPVDFDVEIFRESFNKKITMAHIRKGLRVANQYKDQEELDTETAKSILKKVLLQKEEEFNKIVRNN